MDGAPMTLGSASLRFAAMKLPTFFRRDPSPVVSRDTQAQAEKLLAESFRHLGAFFSKVADLIEAQRLSKSGYGDQNRYLERTDGSDEAPKDPKQP